VIRVLLIRGGRTLLIRGGRTLLIRGGEPFLGFSMSDLGNGL